MNIAHWIRKWGDISPQKTAIIDNGHEFSYDTLNQGSNQVANFLLKRGIKKGERLGVLLYNCHEYVEIYCALAKIGAILVPINWRMAPPEIAYILEDCKMKFLFFGQAMEEQTGPLLLPWAVYQGLASAGQSSPLIQMKTGITDVFQPLFVMAGNDQGRSPMAMGV